MARPPKTTPLLLAALQQLAAISGYGLPRIEKLLLPFTGGLSGTNWHKRVERFALDTGDLEPSMVEFGSFLVHGVRVSFDLNGARQGTGSGMILFIMEQHTGWLRGRLLPRVGARDIGTGIYQMIDNIRQLYYRTEKRPSTRKSVIGQQPVGGFLKQKYAEAPLLRITLATAPDIHTERTDEDQDTVITTIASSIPTDELIPAIRMKLEPWHRTIPIETKPALFALDEIIPLPLPESPEAIVTNRITMTHYNEQLKRLIKTYNHAPRDPCQAPGESVIMPEGVVTPAERMLTALEGESRRKHKSLPIIPKAILKRRNNL